MFRSPAYPQATHHCSYCDLLILICHHAYRRILLESLRQRVRRHYRGCGPGPSQKLGGRGSSYHNLPDQLPRSHGLLTK